MLPKKKRINRELFAEIEKASKRFDARLFLLRVRFLRNNEPSKFSCIVSKKVSKSAVSRNRLRRVFYEAIRKASARHPKGGLFVFYPKPHALKAPQKDFEKEIKTALGEVVGKQ